jgi:hypothetical protein
MSPSLLTSTPPRTPRGNAINCVRADKRSHTMTSPLMSAARYRSDPLAGHTYQIPIVRELPARPADARDQATW